MSTTGCFERLDAIRAHGDPARFASYLPTYLLKCLQDHLGHHAGALHSELKHIRNALKEVCPNLRFVDKASARSRQIAAIAAAHRVLRASAPMPSDPRQMALF